MSAPAVRTVSTGGDFAVSWGPRSPLALMAGPCVIESRAHCLGIARKLAALADRLGIPFVFKASFDKANRSSLDGYRGPGIDKGLAILAEVRERVGVPVLTDVHEPWQAERCAKAGIDVIQIPAFLCRQTDLLLAAGGTGLVVNVKKMQGMAPEAMAQVVRKIESTGNRKIVLTERGESFGYGNLVADLRNLMVMRELGYPVVFDATHSVQRPGALGSGSGGDSKWAPALAPLHALVHDALFVAALCHLVGVEGDSDIFRLKDIERQKLFRWRCCKRAILLRRQLRHAPAGLAGDGNARAAFGDDLANLFQQYGGTV